MDFNINNTISDMLNAMKASVGEQWKDVQGTASSLLQKKADRLKSLAEDLVNKEITEDDFKSFLEDEKLLMEAELNAIAVISKAMAQKAINAALDVLTAAAQAAAKTIL